MNQVQKGERLDGEVVEEPSSADVSFIELRLPCRSFRIAYKVAEAGEFSLTTEFLLRLLRLVDGLPERSISEFFAFTNDETRFVVDFVESLGFAKRANGKIHLTDAGHRLFTGSDDPALFEVHAKQERFEFDLVSYSPADSFRVLDDFEFRLPELQVSNGEDGEHGSQLVLRAFKKYFQEFRLRRGGSRLEKQTLYTVDEVQAEQRFSTLVPLTLAVRINEPGLPEAILTNWRSGAELDDRAAIVQRCASFAREIRWRSDQVSAEAVELLARFAPVQLVGLHKSGKLNAEGFFKTAVKQAGGFRVDRPTVRTIGQLWTDENRLKFASALSYSMKKSVGPPKMQFWLRPSVPYWGTTKRVAEITSAVERQFSDAAENGDVAVRSIVIGDDQQQMPFNHVFNGVIHLHTNHLPSGLEIFLVPGHIAYVALYTPIGQTEGYPISIGAISFDREAVERVQVALSAILDRSPVAPPNCDWGDNDIMSSIRTCLQPGLVVDEDAIDKAE